MDYKINDIVIVDSVIKVITDIEYISDVYVYYFSDNTSCGVNKIKSISSEMIVKIFIDENKDTFNKGILSIINEPVITNETKPKNFWVKLKEFF